MPRDGEVCSQAGEYGGTCNNGHRVTARYKKGDRFEGCPTCERSGKHGGAVMNWQLVRPLGK